MGYDVTTDGENETSAGDAFVVRRWNPSGEFDYPDYQMLYRERELEWSLPPLFKLLKSVCLFGCCMMLAEIIRFDNPVQEFRYQPAYYVIGGICFAGWLGVFLWEKTRPKETISEPDYAAMAARAKEFLAKAQKELGLPDSAIEIDVLAERFVMKDGEPQHKRYDPLNEYYNYSCDAYVQDGSLFLAYGAELWKIPLASLRAVKRLKHRASFGDWNKDAPYNAKMYKRYKITVNEFGTYYAHCYQVEIADSKGEFYLLIPDYDMDAFSELTGLYPENDK